MIRKKIYKTIYCLVFLYKIYINVNLNTISAQVDTYIFHKKT